jgi:hypothetical protein
MLAGETSICGIRSAKSGPSWAPLSLPVGQDAKMPVRYRSVDQPENLYIITASKATVPPPLMHPARLREAAANRPLRRVSQSKIFTENSGASREFTRLIVRGVGDRLPLGEIWCLKSQKDVSALRHRLSCRRDWRVFFNVGLPVTEFFWRILDFWAKKD